MLFDEFKQYFNIKSLKYDFTIWFHLTRTFPSKNFDKGILPLHNIIDEIWDSLYYLVKDILSEKRNGIILEPV